MSDTIVRPISDKADSCLRQFNKVIDVLKNPLFQCPAPKAVAEIPTDLISELSLEKVVELHDRFFGWGIQSGARWPPGFEDNYSQWGLYPRPLDLPSNDVDVGILALILELLEELDEELEGGKQRSY